MKKGFTLVELLAVIIILGIIALITFPIVDKSIENSKQAALERTIDSILDAAHDYSIQNKLGYSTEENTLSLDQLKNSGFLEVEIINPVTNEEMQGCVLYKWDEVNKQYVFRYDEECKVAYNDNSGANAPKLYNNMIPIRYDGSNWIYADTKEAWYNYDKKEWANAVVLNSGVTKNVGDVINESEIALWYVWIPRYKYQLFNADNKSVDAQVINIEFENGIATTGTVSCQDAINQTDSEGNQISEICTNASNGNWYTHPAFTFGSEELSGFWVGKFEISTTDTTCNTTPNATNCNKVLPISIKPGVSSYRYANNYNFFESIKKIKEDYNLNGDSHMIKNMEWGAVAYLKQSKYGLSLTDIAINRTTYYTGGGAGNAYKDNVAQSTTGNIYGVYDLSGGTLEYVMANMVDSSGTFLVQSSGFANAPEEKYYDKYTYGTSNTTHSRGKLGDATKETLTTFGSTTGGWYSDFAYFVFSTYPWVYRGGKYNIGSSAGVFYFSNHTGYTYSDVSSRAVLS